MTGQQMPEPTETVYGNIKWLDDQRRTLGVSLPTAEQLIAEELHELESLAALLLTVQNQLRKKSKDLYTGAQVGDYQTSEAELVATPLRKRIIELEAGTRADQMDLLALRKLVTEMKQELEQYRKAHVCTDACRPNEHLGFVGKDLVQELRQRIAELEAETADWRQAECSGVHRLEQQLATAQSQIRGLRASRDELAARVADMQGWLDLKTGELASANEQRDQAREQERRARAAWETEIERGRDLEADLSRIRTDYTKRQVLAEDVLRSISRIVERVKFTSWGEDEKAALRLIKIQIDRLDGSVQTPVREANLEQELDRANAEFIAMKLDRDAQQEAKNRALEKLATIKQIAHSLTVQDELGSVTHRQDPGALARAVLDIQESLEDFS